MAFVRRQNVVMAAAPSDVFVLGLDKVFMNFARENVVSACRASVKMFPKSVPDTVLNDPEILESVVETVSDTDVVPEHLISMVKHCAENDMIHADSLRNTKIETHKFQAAASDSVLREAFIEAQEEFMSEDNDRWLEHVSIYPRVAESLKECPYPFYIATSQSSKAASLVLNRLLGQDIDRDSPRLLVTTEDKRADAIQEINSRPLCQDAKTRLHFIDSSATALEKVKASSDLKTWKLYHAAWGLKDSQNKSGTGVNALSLADFCELLKWGIIMGVDDGCEPTPEEVQAGVSKAP